MAQVELTLRLLTLGQLLLLALICLRAWNRGLITRLAFLLSLGVGSYLMLSSPDIPVGRETLIFPVVLFFADVAPYLIWAFALALFQDRQAIPLFFAAIFLGAGAIDWSITMFIGPQSAEPFHVVHRIIALTAIGHAVYVALKGLKDDLSEQRRRFRSIFTVLIAFQTIAVLTTELIFGFEGVAKILTLINVTAIFALTTGFNLSMLSLRDELFPEMLRPKPRTDQLPPQDRHLQKQLDAFMNDGGYRQTGLTISALSEALDVPEHRLRKLINRHLGYRNFSSFLNSFRIEEAQQLLKDEAQAHIPILTIAMDLGYASIGPFNRAFKDLTGQTPSEFRQNGEASILEK